eukprot:gene29015-35020_t
MGCCQSKANNGAFRRSTIQNNDLVEDLLPKAPNASVFIIRLISLSDIPVGNMYKNWSDAFVELTLLPKDAQAGDQKQSSSTKPSTLNPKWEPPERFQFIVSQPSTAKILFSVYHYVLADPKNSVPLGDGVLKLSGMPAPSSTPSSPEERSIPLTSPTDASIQEHVVYEYQRWQPGYNWGMADDPSKLLLPTDPGRWSSEDGKKFGKTLESVAPPIDGVAGGQWEVTKGWHTVSTDTDPDGWQYAVSFDSPYWHHENNSSTYVVRRRSWHREVRRAGTLAEVSSGGSKVRNPSIASAGSTESGAGTGRRQRIVMGKRK